ncbi:MAG: twin-arginine translocase TatA/TatE family subunit [Proteobacteria bacterium]|nr:twin-arginine translocase TatA/TatE family subunit [Pseudomonadota bacterium]
MFGLGIGEILVILIVILLFGAKRLPDLGSSLGIGIKNFKKGFKEDPSIDVTPDKEKIEEEKK